MGLIVYDSSGFSGEESPTPSLVFSCVSSSLLTDIAPDSVHPDIVHSGVVALG